MNTTNFEQHFKTPELAQAMLDRFTEMLSGVTIGGIVKVDEVKPKILSGSAAFSIKKPRARKKTGAYWVYLRAMERVSLDR